MSGRAVSPHPGPLPEERGNGSQRSAWQCAQDARTRDTFLPLRWGEGRGEGEGTELTPTRPDEGRAASLDVLRAEQADDGLAGAGLAGLAEAVLDERGFGEHGEVGVGAKVVS